MQQFQEDFVFGRSLQCLFFLLFDLAACKVYITGAYLDGKGTQGSINYLLTIFRKKTIHIVNNCFSIYQTSE